MSGVWLVALLSVVVAEPLTAVTCPPEFKDAGCRCEVLDSDISSVISIACMEAGLLPDQVGRALTNNAEGDLPNTLVNLTIKNQNFPELPENFIGVENYDEIVNLDLSNNNIEAIKGKTFHHMYNLDRLILDNNRWTVDRHSHRVFSSINSIRTLSLRHAFNQDTSQTSLQSLQDVFRESGLRDLKELALSDNGLTHVSASIFQDLPDLTILDLSKNRLTEVEGLFNASCRDYDYSKTDYSKWLISRICSLEELNLDNNSIHGIPMTFIGELLKMQSFRKLNIANNKIICDCDAIPFIEWLNSDSANIIVDKEKLACTGRTPWEDSSVYGIHTGLTEIYHNPTLLDKLRLQCSDPITNPETPISGVNSCPTYHYSKRCTCTAFYDGIVFNCTNQNFSPSDLKPLGNVLLQNVDTLILTGNNFPTFHLDDFIGSDKFKEFDALNTLVLSYNNIGKLGSKDGRGPFDAASDIRRLVLDDNQLDVAGSEHEFLKDLEYLEYLSLKNAFKLGAAVNLSKIFIRDTPEVGLLPVQYLNLEGNDLEMVDGRVFQYLPELQHLRLGHNKIASLYGLVNSTCISHYGYPSSEPQVVRDENLWTEQITPCNLRTLSLVNNNITTVPYSFLETLKKISSFKYLDISHNRFDCGCGGRALYDWLNDESNEGAYTIAHKGQLLCSTPMRLYGRPITSLTQTDLDQCHLNVYKGTPPEPKVSNEPKASNDPKATMETKATNENTANENKATRHSTTITPVVVLTVAAVLNIC